MRKLKINQTGKINGLNVMCVPGGFHCSECVFCDYNCNDMNCRDCFYIEIKDEVKKKNLIDSTSLELFILSELKIITSFIGENFQAINEDLTEEAYNPKSFARGKYLAYMNILNKINILKNNQL